MITGSKFFTGPPFCGALLIPTGSGFGRDGPPLPPSFADYFTRSEVPPALQSQAQHLSPALNLGLLFRWTGALREMRSFYCVSSPQRTAILQGFSRELVESIRRNPDLRLLDCVPPQRWQDSDLSLWDAQPTIFSFAVRNPDVYGPHRWLPLRELKVIYYLLNRDCASSLPPSASPEELVLAAQKCHIGQPITVARDAGGRETSAMRIACGARLVYGITFDAALGRSPAERFQQELRDAQTVLAKVSLILRYWRGLTEL